MKSPPPEEEIWRLFDSFQFQKSAYLTSSKLEKPQFSIRDLSWGNSVKHLCGLEKPQFSKLLGILAEPLQNNA